MSSFGKIAAQMTAGVKRELLSQSKVRLTLPWGFPYEAYGPKVVVKPWHVLNLVECGRALSFNRLPSFEGEPFLASQDLYRYYQLFQGSAKLSLSKHIYDITLPKSPLTLEKELVYVGKSSFNINTLVLLPSESLVLASCQAQSVLVDIKTRRPASFPDWWREKFAQNTDPGQSLKVNVQPMPVLADEANADPLELSHQDLPITESVTSVDIDVSESDLDSYGHVNWTTFLKYALDGVMAGVSICSETTRRLLGLRALKSAEIAYVREGNRGQRLNIKFWKDRSAPGTVHVHMIDSQSQELVTYAALQYYPSEEACLSQEQF